MRYKIALITTAVALAVSGCSGTSGSGSGASSGSGATTCHDYWQTMLGWAQNNAPINDPSTLSDIDRLSTDAAGDGASDHIKADIAILLVAAQGNATSTFNNAVSVLGQDCADAGYHSS